MRFVLDASLALSWLFEDERSSYAESVKNALVRHRAIVPLLWRIEVANALVVAERRKRIAPDTVARAAGSLNRLPIETDDALPDLHALAALAQSYGTSAYDAVYLDLALRRRIPIATLDERLRVACEAARVEAFSP